MDSQLIDGCDAAAEEPREAPAPGWVGAGSWGSDGAKPREGFWVRLHPTGVCVGLLQDKLPCAWLNKTGGKPAPRGRGGEDRAGLYLGRCFQEIPGKCGTPIYRPPPVTETGFGPADLCPHAGTALMGYSSQAGSSL